MSDYLNGVLGDYGEEDVQSFGSMSYPTIQYMNGKKQLAQLGNAVPYTGGWFLSSNMAERLHLEPEHLKAWTSGTNTYHNGQTEDGWFIKDLTVAVIAMRRAWEFRVGRRTIFYPWSQYQKAKVEANHVDARPSGRVHVMVAVRDWPRDAIVVLTIGGTNSGAMWELVREGAARQLLAPVAKLLKASAQRIPHRLFWLTFGPVRDEKGRPIFPNAGSGDNKSPVTPPKLIGIPETVDQKYIDSVFVDAEDKELRPNLTMFDSVFSSNECKAWMTEWDKSNADSLGYDDEASGKSEESGKPADAFDSDLDTDEIPF